jgi:hypothetical protein
MVQTIKETKRIASPSIEVRDAQSLTSRTAEPQMKRMMQVKQIMQ